MKKLIGFLTILGLLSCNANAPIVGTNRSLQLLVFSAPWCGHCNLELPHIQEWSTTATGKRVKIKVMVVTGQQPSQPPTEEVVSQYRSKLNLTIPMEVDPWRFTNYKKYYEGFSLMIPAFVVLKEDGSILRVIQPGSMTPQDLFFYVGSQLTPQ